MAFNGIHLLKLGSMGLAVSARPPLGLGKTAVADIARFSALSVALSDDFGLIPSSLCLQFFHHLLRTDT
jgi:hypothetical protein